ncbi:Protein CASP [Armadillidium nasatum]|uniref:Protein CASP n=1 Tax=Armadillidium nasatum TaxID=96803 RepID=A0A5N5STI8_9CRUS|nr:Protein CASP [Armadillidium nasatum]
MTIKLQAVLAAWKSFDLNAIQHDLDETASEITLRQDESEASRKKLVEQLKECKKDSPDETKALAPLIKSFQNEVDNLRKRSKFAESAFLKNYQKFLDIIDPVPSLEYSIGLEKKVCVQEELELENKRMKKTIQEYNEELSEVKNQDVTIKSLKEKVKKLENEIDLTVNNKSKLIEQEYSSLYSEKEQLLLETHEHNVQKLKETEERCQMLQSSLEQTQSELFEKELTNKPHQPKKNWLKLKFRMTGPIPMMIVTKIEITPSMKTIELLSLESEITTKDKEISQLVNDIKNLGLSLSKLKESSSTQITSLEDELSNAKSVIQNYEEKLNEQKDYHELKRELAIIKSIEFDCTDGVTEKSPFAVSKPLELLLLEKNKVLQNENTVLKVKVDDLNHKCENLCKENENLKTLSQEQQILISQLESDLASVQSISPMNPREGATQMELISEAIKDVNPVETRSVTPLQRVPSESSASGDHSSTAESLLSIVSAQRERFKIRNEELEADTIAKGSQIIMLQNEIDSLRSDNLKLYEKIRFLQSYEGNSKSASDTPSEIRYSNQYENSLDPFMTFSQKEKHKRYLSLSPFEKITFSIGQFILKSKKARTATFMYVSLLHCLVFIVLYKFAFTESYKRDFYSDCAQKFAEHMHDVHGEN